MRPVALVMAVAVALSASPAVAEDVAPKSRGFRTGLGLGFLLVSGVGLGLGIGGTLNATQADAALAEVTINGQAKKGEYAMYASEYDQVRTTGTVLAVVGFGVALASLITSIVLFVIDAPKLPVNVSFMP
ncbi:MAG: hypothetical protein ACO1OB_17505, partial [Archangium sp.]